jgi:hypothetical protein
MPRGYHAGDLTMEQLEAKFDQFAKDMPEYTKEGLKRGTDMLKKEMQSRYPASGLKRKSGKLYRAIKVLNVDRAGHNVKAAVGIGMVDGHSQVYKGVAHELGLTVGRGVTLPKRAFVEPTKRAKLEQVKQILLDELMEGYRKSV